MHTYTLRGLYRTGLRSEKALAVLMFALLCGIPLAETCSREVLGHSLPGGTTAVQYLTLAVTFLGAAMAARGKKLLALSTTRWIAGSWQRPVRLATALLTVAITASLIVASVELISVDRAYGTLAVWDIPIWLISLVMPLGLAGVIAWVMQTAGKSLMERAVLALGLLAPAVLGMLPASAPITLVWGLGAIILLATVLGLPIFAAVGAGALLLGWQDGAPLSAVAGEAYRLVTSPLLPAIPLFTLAGFLLANGGSGHRLLRRTAPGTVVRRRTDPRLAAHPGGDRLGRPARCHQRRGAHPLQMAPAEIRPAAREV